MGALDGQNQTFLTSRVMRSDMPVEVFVNGDRMLEGLDDGFEVVSARTIRLKVPPMAEDTIAVKFSADPPAIGLLNGAPQISTTQVLGSQVTIGAQVVPDVAVVVVQP